MFSFGVASQSHWQWINSFTNGVCQPPPMRIAFHGVSTGRFYPAFSRRFNALTESRELDRYKNLRRFNHNGKNGLYYEQDIPTVKN